METKRQLRQRLEQTEAVAEERLRLLNELERSSSWRLTAPLRAARQRLGGSALATSAPDHSTNGAEAPTVPTGGFEPTQREPHGLWRRPWRDGDDPPERVGAIPAMITDDERRLLYWLTREYFTGEGAILDAGCYLGGSTAALAAGLADRAEVPPGAKITSYDLFLLDYFMLVDIPDDMGLDEGDSFRPVFDRHLAGYEQFLDVREGNILEHGWSGEPIEIAFLDVLKSWPINDFVLEEFFGSMIPGRTIIVQQDFVHEFAPWIHVTMGMLSPYVELLDMFEVCSSVYLLKAPIPEAVLKTKTGKDLTPAEIIGYMDTAIEPATGEVRGTLEAAKATLLRLVEGREAMEAQLDAIEAEYDGSWRVARSVEMVQAWGTMMGYRDLKLRGKRDSAGTDPAE
jgi:hypothetical protein